MPLEEGEVESNEDTSSEVPPSLEPPVQEKPEGVFVSDEEIKAAEKELANLNKPAIDYNEFARILSQQNEEALKRVIPKTPDPTPFYETDDFIKDRRNLVKGMNEFWEAQKSKYHKEVVEPLVNQLNEVRQLLPSLYFRAAENPHFQTIQERAKELMDAGMPYQNALAYASRKIQDELKTSPKKQLPPKVPGHMSSPNTSPTGNQEVSDNGPGDFKSIVRELKASGKY